MWVRPGANSRVEHLKDVSPDRHFANRHFANRHFTKDIWPTDICPTDIWPTDIWPTDIWPTDIWLTDKRWTLCLVDTAMAIIDSRALRLARF